MTDTSSFVRILRRIALPLVVISMVMSLTSCNDDDDDSAYSPTEKTLFLYYPWSGSSFALTNFFYENIEAIKQSVCDGLGNERIVVFISTASTRAKMFEIVCNNGICEEVKLKDYDSPALTTAAGITEILNDVKLFAPALSYAMVIGGHGLGWVTAEGYDSGKTMRRLPYLGDRPDGTPLTRYFGGSQTSYRTDITTLADGISNAGMRMEYILFDVCYMSTIEVVYDLRHVTDYVIACPTEIMNIGMPYVRIGRHLLGTTNYAAIVSEYLSFYSSHYEPYATMGITDCSRLDSLATVMREINARFTFDDSHLADLQQLDGESEGLFYDFGNYVDHLCTDSTLLATFRGLLARTVPYHAHTPYFPYAYGGSLYTREIRSFSGLTTSAPSKNRLAKDVVNTSWHIATHQ